MLNFEFIFCFGHVKQFPHTSECSHFLAFVLSQSFQVTPRLGAVSLPFIPPFGSVHFKQLWNNLAAPPQNNLKHLPKDRLTPKIFASSISRISVLQQSDFKMDIWRWFAYKLHSEPQENLGCLRTGEWRPRCFPFREERDLREPFKLF